MTRKDQKHVTRRQMDSRVEPFRTMRWTESPRSGWIRAIRDGLGMTGAQLAKRLGIKQPTVVEFERNEVERRITLDTLDRAAKALGCRLVYALVPEQSLETTVQSRARALARKRFAHLGTTMRLEDQAMDKETEAWHLERLAQQLAADAPSSLWDDE